MQLAVTLLGAVPLFEKLVRLTLAFDPTLNSVSLKLTYPAYLMKKLLLEHLEHTVAKVYSCWVTWHAIQDTHALPCVDIFC
jgi:hypothetical protein